MTPAPVSIADRSLLHEHVIEWFDREARELPWREDPSPWRVMVSEFMLQQTPVTRVLPVFDTWLVRWPTPSSLAADSTGEAVRAWGRLGYPRRALRLHAAATAIVETHGGQVPSARADLLALPGVGEYTAGAIASFAFGDRQVVLDTNVRRVFARVLDGAQFPADAVTAAEREVAREMLPRQQAHRWAAATMELGAVVCTARSPRCGDCPVADLCRWRAAGFPEHTGPARRGQAWAGTDRQCRGRLMAVLRDSADPVPRHELEAAWDDQPQRDRCLNSLIVDQLVEPLDDGFFGLPT